MRPELDHCFCGRCGEPCRGFREPLPEREPPWRCAECAIEARMGDRWQSAVGALLVTAFSLFGIGGILCSAGELILNLFHPDRNIGPFLLITLLTLGLLIVPIYMLVMAALTALRGAREEFARVDRIREFDLRPRMRSADEVQVSTESAPTADGPLVVARFIAPRAAMNRRTTNDRPDGP